MEVMLMQVSLDTGPADDRIPAQDQGNRYSPHPSRYARVPRRESSSHVIANL
jgi:hypothetical protein